jgi:hypothetical protein
MKFLNKHLTNEQEKKSKLVSFYIFIFASITSYCLTNFLKTNLLENVLYKFWQYLDIPILLKDPFDSLLYNHSQPPLVNGIVVFLSLFGKSIYSNFIILNSICVGIVCTILFKVTFSEINRLTIPIITAVVYLLLPETILNVAFPFYPCITAALYSVLFYSLYSKKNPSLSLFLFVFSCEALTLLRASFSLLHVMFFLCVFWSIQKRNFSLKKQVITSLLVIFFAMIIPVKNFNLYGFFGPSSWAPMNVHSGLGMPTKYQYFMYPKEISKTYPELKCRNSYHLQDSLLEKSDGSANFNSCLILELAKLIKEEGYQNYNFFFHLRNIIINTQEYFSPPDQYFLLTNKNAISSYSNFINSFLLTTNISFLEQGRVRLFDVRALIVIGLALAVFFAFKRNDKCMKLCLLIIFIHFLTHVLTSGRESKRFVIDVEFMFLILFSLCFSKLKKVPITFLKIDLPFKL